MGAAYLLSFYDPDITSVDQTLTCTIEDLIHYIENNSFKEESIGNFLKKIGLRDKIKAYLSQHSDTTEQDFLSSSALRLVNALRLELHTSQFSNKTETIEKRLEQYCQYFILPNPVQENNRFKDYYAIDHSEYSYARDNNPLHDACFNLLAPPDKRYDFNSLTDISNCLEKRSFGNTPLCLACKTKNSKLAQRLINLHQQHHVDINQCDNLNMSPLHWACFYRDDALIERLLSAGADPNARNIQRQSALDIYQGQIPKNISIAHKIPPNQIVTPGSPLLMTTQIHENGNQFLYANLGVKEIDPNAFIDIIFHMDQIAFNQLDIPSNVLLQELEKINGDRVIGDIKKRSFYIFSYYHFNDLIQTRNNRPCSEQILKNLSISQKTETAESAPQINYYTLLMFLIEIISNLIRQLFYNIEAVMNPITVNSATTYRS